MRDTPWRPKARVTSNSAPRGVRQSFEQIKWLLMDYMASFGLTCSEIGLLQGLFSCPRCWVLQIQNAGNDLNLLQVASLEGLQAV